MKADYATRIKDNALRQSLELWRNAIETKQPVELLMCQFAQITARLPADTPSHLRNAIETAQFTLLQTLGPVNYILHMRHNPAIR